MDFWDLGDNLPDDSLRRHPEPLPTPQIVRLHEVEDAPSESQPPAVPSREADHFKNSPQ